MDQPTELSEEDAKLLMEAVEAERKRAKEALDILFNSAERNQNLKLGALRTRALAGFVAQLSNQNNSLVEQLQAALEALEAEKEGGKKRKLWRPTS